MFLLLITLGVYTQKGTSTGCLRAVKYKTPEKVGTYTITSSLDENVALFTRSLKRLQYLVISNDFLANGSWWPVTKQLFRTYIHKRLVHIPHFSIISNRDFLKKQNT